MATVTEQVLFVVQMPNGRYRVSSLLPVGQPLRVIQRWVARGSTAVAPPDHELTAEQVADFKQTLGVKFGCNVEAESM